jgi:hypothetical protein
MGVAFDNWIDQIEKHALLIFFKLATTSCGQGSLEISLLWSLKLRSRLVRDLKVLKFGVCFWVNFVLLGLHI